MQRNNYGKVIKRVKGMRPATKDDILIGNDIYKLCPTNDRMVVIDKIRPRLVGSKWHMVETEKEYQDYLDFYETLIEKKQLFVLEDGKAEIIGKRDPELFD